MCKTAKESANTGFRIIKDILDSHSPEMMMKSLLVDLDEDYEKIEEISSNRIFYKFEK